VCVCVCVSYSLRSMCAHTGKPTHEQAVRIVLASLERSAARYQRHIVPLISLSMDFYVRMFVRVYTRPEEAKRSMLYSPSPLVSAPTSRSVAWNAASHSPFADSTGSCRTSTSALAAARSTSSRWAGAKARAPPRGTWPPVARPSTETVTTADVITRYKHSAMLNVCRVK
jgi:hypothetical protein